MDSSIHDMNERRHNSSQSPRLSVVSIIAASVAMIVLLFVMRFILDQGIMISYFEMRTTEDGLELTNQAWGLALWLLVMVGASILVIRWLRSREFPLAVDASVILAVLVVGIVIGRSMMRLDLQYLLLDGGAIQVMSTWMVIAALAVPLLLALFAGWQIGARSR